MKDQNIIIISLDEVRPDHLSCYGYQKINTSAIDQVAKEGVRFETCITSADFTPIAMGSVITGKYPNKTGVRGAYDYLAGPTIATILKEDGYRTAGFVGNGVLAKSHGFAQGFDFFNEASKDTACMAGGFPDAENYEILYEGNYWVEEFFNWLKNNYQQKFFIWGHLYETHEGSENSLLKKGLIKEGVLPEFGYYDAKIKMADKKLIGRLLTTLDDLGITKNTTLVVMSDHGTNLGEYPTRPIPWRKGRVMYPQHTTMHDCDLKVAMMIRGEGLPQGIVIKNMVRSIDLVPTLLDLVSISTEEYDFDGSSLLPVIEKGEIRKEVYSEDLFEPRGKGALQSLRTEEFKFMRNLTLNIEEYYNLPEDPQEKNNIIDQQDKETIINLRRKLNAYLRTKVTVGKEFSQKEKEAINRRLRSLGYIE